MDPKLAKNRIVAFWSENEAKIVLVAGFLLVSIVAFEFGLMHGQKWQQKPLIIEKTALSEDSKGEVVNFTTTNSEATQGANLTVKNSLPAVRQDCAYVGSKNSNKYHLPTCSFAKRIKPENVVCFKSVEEAVAKGYQADKGCIK